MILKATKDLVHNDGTMSFTKGKEYRVQNPATIGMMNRRLTNNQGEHHTVGNWWMFFKKVSG